MAQVDDRNLVAELQKKVLVSKTKLDCPPAPCNTISSQLPTDKDLALLNELVKRNHSLDILANPRIPLYSVETFQELNLRPELLKSVLEMGCVSPSKLQQIALPILIADSPQNMIVQSKSDVNRTMTYILASLSHIDTNLKYPHVLVLSSMYKRAMKIGNVVEQMTKFWPKIEFCYALTGLQLNRGSKITAQIMIGTPGKVYDWAMHFKFFDLKKLKVIVLDEADLLIQDYRDQCLRIHKQLPSSCQIMIFSQTYSEDSMKIAEQFVTDPVIIKDVENNQDLNTTAQYFIVCKNQAEKCKGLSDIHGAISSGQAIIFCDTKKSASFLIRTMCEGHDAVALLSKNLTWEQKMTVINRFREQKEKVLITNNSFGNAIDYEDVTVVVNFDFPMNLNGEADLKTYMRQIRRLSRFGKAGVVISFIDSSNSVTILQDIEKHFEKKITDIDDNEIANLNRGKY